MGDGTLWNYAHDKLHGLKKEKTTTSIPKGAIKKAYVFSCIPTSVQWSHSSINQWRNFYFFMCVRLTKNNLHLIWVSLSGSKLFKSSLHPSYRIMLWNNKLIIRMSKMISWSHNRNGFALMWKQILQHPKCKIPI